MTTYSVTIWNHERNCEVIFRGKNPSEHSWNKNIAEQIAANHLGTTDLEIAKIGDAYKIRKIGIEYPHAILEPV